MIKNIVIALTAFLAFGCGGLASRVGKAWTGSPQLIPGKIECELFNLGGEGIAYHDDDSVNNGSGKLNPVDGNPLNEFRMKEGVDISYTKAHGIDDNPYNRVPPEMNQLYVGWTQPGEWINYDVIVQETGKYTVGIRFTSNRGGKISLAIDGKDSVALTIPSTYDAMDTVAWRQWHHWDSIESPGVMQLRKGHHILRLQTIAQGNMNFDYLLFTKTD